MAGPALSASSKGVKFSVQRVFCCIHLVDSVRDCPTANAASCLSGVKRMPVSMETVSRSSSVSVGSSMSSPTAP